MRDAIAHTASQQVDRECEAIPSLTSSEPLQPIDVAREGDPFRLISVTDSSVTSNTPTDVKWIGQPNQADDYPIDDLMDVSGAAFREPLKAHSSPTQTADG